MAPHPREPLSAARGQRAERHALVELHVVADHGGLAYHHARSVVDEEVLADLGTRADVDARAAVRELGHDARDDGYVLLVEHVRDTVHVDGVQARIREDDLLLRAGGRISVVERLNVGEQHPLDAGKLVEEHRAHLRGAIADALGSPAAQRAGRVGLLGVAVVGRVGEGEDDLLAQRPLDLDERLADEVLRTRGRREHLVAEIARKQHPPQVLENPLHGRAAGKLPPRFREEYLVGLVVLLDALYDAIEVVSEHRTSCSRSVERSSPRRRRAWALPLPPNRRPVAGRRQGQSPCPANGPNDAAISVSPVYDKCGSKTQETPAPRAPDASPGNRGAFQGER